MVFSPTKTPKLITQELKSACRKIADSENLQFLNIKPREGYLPNKCALNAHKEAKTIGGKVVLGWSVFVWENVMYDFIGHAVVELDGETYCVTPSKTDEKIIPFIADASIVFDYEDPNSRMPSIEVAISKRTEVKKLLDVMQKIRNIKIQYPVTSDAVAISVDDSRALSLLENEQLKLIDRVNYHHHPVKNKCPCGSGKQFRKCCRPHMRRAFS